MPVTPYPDVDEILASLLSQLRKILGARLVGLYLYGSLVTGDFDYAISDVDLLAVLSSGLDDKEFNDLNQMQTDLVARHRQWDDRIEIAYLPTAALQTFRSHASQIAVISPGEPFHCKEAGNDWLINWYTVREKGLTLFGPSPKTLIDPISREEFMQAVQKQTQDWGEWIYEMRRRPSQAYAILTMCRALYAYRNGEQVSKQRAARWAQKEFPQWSSLVENALLWRETWRDEGVDPAATFPETLRFVQFAIGQIGTKA